jgi:uncharacterized protein (DUF58 family)
MTSRAWWFLLLVLSILTLGVCGGVRSLTLLGLTFLLWFLWTWVSFVFRIRLLAGELTVQREVTDERGRVDNLWAGHTFRVDVNVKSNGPLGLPCIRLWDFVPLDAQGIRGTTQCDALLSPGEPAALSYNFRCDWPGRLRFEGVGLQLIDPQGFFYYRTFVRSPMTLRVLPPLADAEGRRPTIKRHNLLPSPGLHRHLRPGSSSELLDLRDYLPGDPPKTIAWKVSARRDRLITKEFETEVPIRCTLFVDISHSVRVGPRGGNALTRLVDISAAVAQASAASRDLCGLCLIDEQEVTSYTRPARGSRHLVQILNRLAEAADLTPATGQARIRMLLNVAHALATDIYPDLLRSSVNRVPPLLPFLWPLTGETTLGTMRRRFWWILFLGAGFAPLLTLVVLLFAFGLMPQVVEVVYSLAQVFLPVPDTVLKIIGAMLVLGGAVFYYAFLSYCFRIGAGALGADRRRLARFRKRLASLLAALHDLGPGGIAALLEDNQLMALHLQRFLADHQVPYPLTLYDERGRYLFASPGKVAVIAQALLRAVGKGHDNELFVLLVDLIELTDHLAPLLRAVKVTLARHHQLLIICPWPADVPLPGTRVPPSEKLAKEPPLLVRQATIRRLHAAYHLLRRTFARVGVPVVCAAEGDPTRLILDRLDRLRYMGLGKRR